MVDRESWAIRSKLGLAGSYLFHPRQPSVAETKAMPKENQPAGLARVLSLARRSRPSNSSSSCVEQKMMTPAMTKDTAPMMPRVRATLLRSPWEFRYVLDRGG